MIGVVTRAGSLAPYLRGATVTVSAGARAPTAELVCQLEKSPIATAPPSTSTLHAMSSARVPAALRIASGLNMKSQVRYAHTDVKVPDFTSYRLKNNIDPNKSSTDESHKGIVYLVSAAGTMASIYCAKNIVYGLVSFMAPSADVLALGKIEIKLSEIPEGKSVVFKWRGKPLFIRHRTASEIEKEQLVDVASLRDQQHDSVRVKDPKWLVVVGVCTHLGCIPIANSGEFGGYYCPCHGSHYDASGRIRKGPAPLNLEVPEYQFMEGGSMLVVG